MSAVARATAQTSRDRRIAGLYAVTPDLADTSLLAELVDAALAGGAALVQYRNKAADPALRAVQAARLADVCKARRRPLIVNDHVELALAIDGAGLHVGSEDIADAGALRALRARLGPSRILGVSCYRSIDRARDAAAAGADYVAFGSVFPSTTKPSAPRATLSLFAEVRALGIACVAIGGIARYNAASLRDAGADAVAVITDLFDGHDPAVVSARATAFANLFRHQAGSSIHTRPSS